MTKQRTLRELISFVKHPPKSIKSMRDYLEQQFYGVGIIWVLFGGALVTLLQSSRYQEAIIGIVIIFPILGISLRVIATSAAEEIERVVKEGEWP